MSQEYVTLAVVKELLAVQLDSFRSSVQLLVNQINEEIKFVKTEVNELKASAQYSSRDIDDIKSNLKFVETRGQSLEALVDGHSNEIIEMADKQEYIENQNRRNNVKLIGVPESDTGVESWVESEEIVKCKVKEALKIEDDLVIERAHRVGQRKRFHTRRDGSVAPAKPRPIVAKFLNWKQREVVINTARKIKPQDIKFVEDFSQRTLLRRSQQIPELQKARDDGKIAFFVGGNLVIKDKPPDRSQRVETSTSNAMERSTSNASEDEITFGNNGGV